MPSRDPPDSVQLSFSADATLRSVLDVALPVCAGLPLQKSSRDRVAILVEELLANLYDHAALPAESMVRLNIAVEGQAVRLTLEDAGPPFDPATVQQDAPISDRGGGAGLRLLRSWATTLSYRAAPPANRLEVLLAEDRP